MLLKENGTTWKEESNVQAVPLQELFLRNHPHVLCVLVSSEIT